MSFVFFTSTLKASVLLLLHMLILIQQTANEASQVFSEKLDSNIFLPTEKEIVSISHFCIF